MRKLFFMILTLSILSLSSFQVQAGQGNMKQALKALKKAENKLSKAKRNKGGHRAKALRLVRDAISEVKSGMKFAQKKGKKKR